MPGAKAELLLDLDFLRDALEYAPSTGKWIWKKRLSNRAPVGSYAGTKLSNGYVMIAVNGARVYSHRLIWFYVYGEWPKEMIDHINGVRDDNRLDNLRLASVSQNSSNGKLRSSNKSGYRGVSWSKEKRKWVSRIVKGNKQHVLGYFETKESAYYAYLQAARNLHGEFARS